MGLFASLRSPEEPLGTSRQACVLSSSRIAVLKSGGARASVPRRDSKVGLRVQYSLNWRYIYWMVRGRANFLEYPRASLRRTNPGDQGC